MREANGGRQLEGLSDDGDDDFSMPQDIEALF